MKHFGLLMALMAFAGAPRVEAHDSCEQCEHCQKMMRDRQGSWKKSTGKKQTGVSSPTSEDNVTRSAARGYDPEQIRGESGAMQSEEKDEMEAE